jgi:CRP-like cAMP-binding protein/glyoxylase-like metal-dependent hydrolase (beta-lactamase superfamily II)
MTLEVHRPYPGVALVVTEYGSVLLGAPTDAFKATKSFCNTHQLPFPRALVAPQSLLVDANPQFNPEFFLYDFLFVYGAAFKPELAHERLLVVADEQQVQGTLRALRMTLLGPSRSELAGYRDQGGHKILTSSTVDQLANISEHMAIKKDGRARAVEEMVETRAFDGDGMAVLFDGSVTLWREGPRGFRFRCGNLQAEIDLSFEPPVVPFATLPVPLLPQTPETFAVKLLGTRSGFDLSGPTTGFLFWLNGRALIYDGPVGTRYLLEHQGIAADDVEGVILSHCHEDHMAAFVELILAGEKPRVYTAEPIYRSALVKLASYFGRPESEVAAFIDYHRVTPGEPLNVNGATLDFFYTVHAIPTIGVSVSMRDRGNTRRVQISGDTMHHDGLEKMKADGVLSNGTFKRMHGLVPKERVDDTLFFADVGEAIIHGNPKDWQGNPNRLFYYHCSDNEKTRGFGHPVAAPGEGHTLIETAKLHPAVPGRLLKALGFLGIDEPAWLASLLFVGRTRTVETGAELAREGEADTGRRFSIIISGSASVRKANAEEPLCLLKPGEFFGAIELIDEGQRYLANIVAQTPMELFDIDAQTFHDYVRAAGLDDRLRQAWRERAAVDSARIFRSLDVGMRNELAGQADEVRFKAGKTILEQGGSGDDFFLLLEGEVVLERNGNQVGGVSAASEDNFFGELTTLYPSRPRHLTVRAATPVRALRVRGVAVQRLAERNMHVRYAIQLAVNDR